jgi:mRNA interferase RelE/StbE
MQIELTRKFQKQVSGCNDQRLRLKIHAVIEAVIASDNMNEFPNLKKLTGYKNSYRIRLGSYRIGIVIENETVIFAAFDHRSDIYKYFP